MLALLEAVEGAVEIDHVPGSAWPLDEIDPFDGNSGVALAGTLAARMIYKQLTHGLRGHDEEMLPVLPVRRARAFHEFQERLVHQTRGGQSVAWILVAHLADGEAPQFVVDEESTRRARPDRRRTRLGGDG